MITPPYLSSQLVAFNVGKISYLLRGHYQIDTGDLYVLVADFRGEANQICWSGLTPSTARDKTNKNLSVRVKERTLSSPFVFSCGVQLTGLAGTLPRGVSYLSRSFVRCSAPDLPTTIRQPTTRTASPGNVVRTKLSK